MVRVTLDIPLRDYVAARVLSAYKGVPLSDVFSYALQVGLQHLEFSKRPEGVPLQSFGGYYALVQTTPASQVFDISAEAELVSIPLLWAGRKYSSLTFAIPHDASALPRVAVGPVYLGTVDLAAGDFLLRIAPLFFAVDVEEEYGEITRSGSVGTYLKYILVPRFV